jgi:hypothetical protein
MKIKELTKKSWSFNTPLNTVNLSQEQINTLNCLNLPAYSTNLMHHAFLANHNWPLHYNNILMNKLNLPLNQVYNLNLSDFQINKNLVKVSEFFEINTLTYFYTQYKLNNIRPRLYNTNIKHDYSLQTSPDIILDFSNCKYNSFKKFDHIYLTLDLKCRNFSYDPNIIIQRDPVSNVLLNYNSIAYTKTLRTFFFHLPPELKNSKEFNLWMEKLEITSSSWDDHFDAWLEYLHLLKKGSSLPPLRVPKLFIQNILQISNFLNIMKVGNFLIMLLTTILKQKFKINYKNLK